MKLYGALISPFVRKVAVVLAEKQVQFTMGRGGPGSDDPEFLAASPFAKIPAIDNDGFRLSDSTAIACYLDRLHPEPKLIPDDPEGYGRVIWYDEFGDTIFAASGLKILFNRLVGPKLLKVPVDEAVAVQGEEELPRSLDYVESQLGEDGWLMGDTFTLADITVASMLCTLRYVGHGVNAALRPRTAAWHARVLARPSWQQVAAIEDSVARRIMPPEVLELLA